MAVISSDILVSTIQNEIQRVQDDLVGVEENLKRLTGRDFNEPRGERRIRLSSGGREDEPPPKRRPPGGVFARLGEPVSEPTPAPRGRRVHEVLEEGEVPRLKPSVASSVARPTLDGKSRTEAAAELTKDRASRDRNRRMFGALLGTLQRFRTEEAKQKGKDEQRAKIEKKLEEKGRAEKEELRKERIELLTQRKERQLRIKRLGFKIERVKEHEAWEANQRRLGHFIRTHTKPRIFWIPKILNPRTTQLINSTKNSIERELEEARTRLKDELDEVLGGRVQLPLREEQDEAEREDLENDLDFNNGSDILDYNTEEGELVYEDDLLLSGKKQKGKAERVVVQVESNVSRAPQRRVELVTVVAERNKRSRDGGGNESEKENMIRSKISSESRNGENVSEKSKTRGRDKEKERDKKNSEKEDKQNKVKEKLVEKKSSSKSHSNKESPTKKKESRVVKKEKKTDDDHKSKRSEEVKNSTTELDSAASVSGPELELSITADDLSQISLPVDPEPTPNVTEVVVQHVPVDSTANGGDFHSGEMQIETVLIKTNHIKKDKTIWDEEFLKRPITIKKEKDATPEKTVEEDVKGKNKGDETSSDSSSESEESSSESEEESSASNTSAEEDSSDSSSSSEDDGKMKKKHKEKLNSRKTKEASSSSSSEDDSGSTSSSDDERKKKSVAKKQSGVKQGRRGEKERPNERKRVDRREGIKMSARKGSRSESRERRRDRSRSKDRRRGRR